MNLKINKKWLNKKVFKSGYYKIYLMKINKK